VSVRTERHHPQAAPRDVEALRDEAIARAVRSATPPDRLYVSGAEEASLSRSDSSRRAGQG
jgi:hypothetical protein